MSTLAIRKGVITAPGATGNQTYNLTTGGSWPSSTTVKALLVWMAYNTAEGVVDATASFTMGIGTYRGSAVQQFYAHNTSVDAGAAAQTVHGTNNDAILRGVVTDTITADFEVDLVSLGSDQFVLDWVDLPATSSLKVHYLCLGGDAIADAYANWSASGVTVGAASNDYSLPSGFGQANLVLIPAVVWTTTGLAQQDGRMMFSAAKSASERRCALWGEDDGAANMTAAAWMKNRAFLGYTANTGTADTEGDVDLSQPTDGWRMNWTDAPGFAWRFGWLALKGDFTATVTSADSPATGGSTTQDLPLASGTPKGALVWGTSIPNNSGAINISAGELGAFIFGATDGTNEGYAGMHQDDSNGTASTGRSHSESKAYASYTPNGTAAPTKNQDCDASFSGSNLRLVWDTTAAAGREYNALILGEPAGATSLPFQSRAHPSRNVLLRR